MQLPHFIFDKKNHFAGRGAARSLHAVSSIVERQIGKTDLFGRGQINVKTRTPHGFACDIHKAGVISYDSVDHRESEAGPLSWFLSRKEWLEDTAANRFIHAGAGVGNTDREVLVFCRFLKSGAQTGTLDQPARENKLAASGHRVPRVDTQIQ